MKCKHCNYEGRGRRGFYTSNTEGEHWKCIVCGELTKIPERLPTIKGYCEDCRFKCDEYIDELKHKGYCSLWEAKSAN